MKEINLPSGNYLFVECRWENFRLWNDYSTFNENKPTQYLVFDLDKENKYIKLDKPKSFEIISTTKDITEEQAESIVDKILYSKGLSKTEHTTEYKNYHGGNSYLWAYESLQSLIQANGLDVNKNYLILKKL